MLLLGKPRLALFVREHADSRIPLDAWRLDAEEAEWAVPGDVQRRYIDSLVQPDRVIFSIESTYKIDVKTKYKQGILLIERVWSTAVSKQGRTAVRHANSGSKT